MTFSLILPLLVVPKWEFPAEPLPSQVARGVKAYVEGRGLERTFLEDRKALGTWFDGKAKRDVEEVIWFTPGIVSRWLGYLEAKEKWPPGVLQGRWSRIREALNGNVVFVVRLSAFPKIDALEPSNVGPSSAIDLDEVRFLVTVGGAWLPRSPIKERWLGLASFAVAFGKPKPGVLGPMFLEPKVTTIARLQSRERRPIERFAWAAELPFSRELSPEFAEGSEDVWLPLGDFHAGWYLLQLPAPDGMASFQDIQVRVFSPRKERIASFSLAPPVSEKAP